MKKILFTHSYFLRFDPKQWKLQQAYPPLGTLYAAAFTRNAGYEVSLFDTMFLQDAEEISPVLKSEKPDVLVIYDDGFNYLTKMCLTNMREAAFEMIGLAKKGGIQVIVSGSDASDQSEKYLDAGADYVLAGEGEITLLEVLNSMSESGDTKSDIPGTILKSSNGIIRNKKREVVRELDTFSHPAWDLIDVKEYKSRWMKQHGYFSLNISTTRGCPFHCNWCAKPIYGNRYNVHSPDWVVEELKFLIATYGVSHFWMTDDIFGLKPGWIPRFAELVKREKLQFRFKIQSRVDLLLEENAIALLAESGCDTIWVGAESGSQKILDAMDKGTKVEQIFTATRLMKKHGIKPAFFLQFGYPGENADDIQATISMVKSLMPDDIGISVSYPLPGTKFFEKVKEELKDKSNWTDSDELAMMFSNTYPSSFYKVLQRYVHRTYRTRQGITEMKNLFSSPVQISFRQLKRIAAIPVHATGSAYYKSKLEIISGEHGLVGIN